MICLGHGDFLYLTESFIIIKLNNFHIKQPQEEEKSVNIFPERKTEMNHGIILILVQLFHFSNFYSSSPSWFTI